MGGVRLAPKTQLAPGFAPWVERWLKTRGLSRSAFAKASGIQPDTFTKLLRDAELRVDVQTFVALARGMNLELSYVLHKAGFDIGADGVNMPRLQRAESIVAAYGEIYDETRYALAETAILLNADDESDISPLVPRDVQEHVTRALTKLEVVTARLKGDGYLVQDPRGSTGRHPRLRQAWSDEEDRMLKDSPNLSDEELASRFGRNVNAVRARRRRVTQEVS